MKQRDEIIKKAESLDTKDLKIRCLSVELAPYFQRDTNFFYLDDEGRHKMYHKGIPLSDTFVICETLCIYYQNLFSTFGIQSEIIPLDENRSVPHYALLVKGDNGWYFIDLLKDLMNNQVGLRTEWYGIIPDKMHPELPKKYPYLNRLPFQYIKSMDEQLGTLDGGGYANDYFDDLKQKLTTNKAAIYLAQFIESPIIPNDRDNMVMNKLDFFNRYLTNYSYIPGPIERAQYYAYAQGKIFNKSERKLITSHCTRENNFEFTYSSRNGKIKFVESYDSNKQGYYIRRL